MAPGYFWGGEQCEDITSEKFMKVLEDTGCRFGGKEWNKTSASNVKAILPLYETPAAVEAFEQLCAATGALNQQVKLARLCQMAQASFTAEETHAGPASLRYIHT